MNKALICLSLFFYSTIVIGALFVWINPYFRTITLEKINGCNPIIICAAVLLMISCIVPMGLSPGHNGEYDTFRNQYEMITEAFLNGQLHFQYEVDDRLLAMENPYDPVARGKQGVDFQWDHALYKGRYYMYFGVVPVFLVFLPYRIVTGVTLTTYHATQLFVAFIITGIFATFFLLCKLFFRKMPLVEYLILSVGLKPECPYQIFVGSPDGKVEARTSEFESVQLDADQCIPELIAGHQAICNCIAALVDFIEYPKANYRIDENGRFDIPEKSTYVKIQARS